MKIPRQTILLMSALMLMCLSTARVVASDQRLHRDDSSNAMRLVLAQQGNAQMPIVIAADASEDVVRAANELAACLKQLSGATFTVVKTPKMDRGIVIANAQDVADLVTDSKLTTASERPEPRQYLIRSEAGRLLLVGAGDFGTCHAVYDLLHRLGYRWYFPMALWSYTPAKVETLSVQVDVEHRPDYFEFYLGSGHHNHDWNWRTRNHPIRNQFWTHKLGHIAVALRDRLKEHPKYNSLARGMTERKPSWWFCLSQPEARRWIAEYVLEYFRKYPDRQGFSLEPADGDGWCLCPQCAKRSPTDWLVTLANETATLLEKEFPDKQLGILAYSRHSPPPTIPVHKMVWIFPTTGFNLSGNSFEQQLRDWGRMTRNPYLGMYDYWNFSIWHSALPQPRGGQIPLIQKTMRESYDLDVRHFVTECIGGWAHCGLAYHVANELSWNLDADVDKIVDDFCSHMFPEATEQMRGFYNALNIDKLYWSDQFVGQLFSYLAEARKQTTEQNAIDRLDQLTLYAVYLDHFRKWRIGEIKDAAFMQFLWKAKSSDALFEADQLWQWLPNRYAVTRPAEAAINVPVADNPWKIEGQFSHDDLVTLNAQGVQKYPIQDIPRATFSEDLVPLNIGQKPLRRLGHTNSRRMYLYTNNDGKLPVITAKAAGSWTLYDSTGHTVSSGQVPADEQPHDLPLQVDAPGLYRLEDANLHKMKLIWPAGSKVVMSSDQWAGPAGNRWHYFYVPKGTKRVAMYMDCQQQHIYDGSDNRVFDASEHSRQGNFVVIDVPKGEDGSIWRIHGYQVANRVEFLNTPPYLSLSPDEMLVPRETINQP